MIIFYKCYAHKIVFGSGKLLGFCEKQIPERLTYHCISDYPVFTSFPSNTSVEEGGSATLPCRARGPDKPIITWTLEDGSGTSTNIVTGVDVQVNPQGDLKYTKVMSKDRGMHICRACNTAGCKTAKAFLDVLCKYDTRIW